jgi:hypothetical protein
MTDVYQRDPLKPPLHAAQNMTKSLEKENKKSSISKPTDSSSTTAKATPKASVESRRLTDESEDEIQVRPASEFRFLAAN